jgi:hypothetical protein
MYGELTVPDFPDLPDLADSIGPVEAERALPDILAAVAGANRILASNEPAPITAPQAETLAGYTAGLVEKLRQWLQALYSRLRTIALALGALSYSVTVGTSISVTIGFGD